MKTKKLILSLFFLLTITGLNEAFSQWNWTTAPPSMWNTNTGNVAIGNSDPGNKLLNVGKNMAEPTVAVRNYGGIGGATFQMIDDATSASWKFKVTSTGGFRIRDHAYALDVLTIEQNSAANVIYVNSNGYVGLNTTTPSRELDVNGEINISNDHDYTFMYLNLTSTFSTGNTGIIYKYDGIYKYWMYWRNADNLLRFTTDAGGNRNDMVMLSDGKIGINTATPLSRFEVKTDTVTFVRLGYSNTVPHWYRHTMIEADGDGQSALYVNQLRDVANNGTGYAIWLANSAIIGNQEYGDLYSFGVTGYNHNYSTRCGGAVGADYTGNYWGSLGYRNSGATNYGGYFTSSTTGAGKRNEQAMTGIGLGAWGDLFGADIHGRVYGIFTEGENYALYAHGATYKDGIDVHLQNNGTENRTVLFTNTSTEVTVQTSGKAVLSGGKASIVFDPAFTSSLASEESLVITVTPVGPSNGVYLDGVTITGFSIAENNAGKSNITVHYIAIGKRAGYENPVLAKEVVDPSYQDKLSRGLHSDADLQTDGEGLYYENGQLVVGIHPSTVPDPSVNQEPVPANKPGIQVQQISGVNDAAPFTGNPEEK